MSTATVKGTNDPRFDKLVDALGAKVAEREELGASVVVDLDGELLVDVWAGHADAARTREWERDTIVTVWSSSKTVLALAALMLVDRGLLDVDERVATYWPEFGAAGKDEIAVRHLLSHTSGISGWDAPWSPPEDVYDFDGAVARLAEQAPWWEPGTASGYHANNQGHLVGELVRRVTGLRYKEFVRTQIAEPLGADFQIGARPEDTDRIAEIVPPPPLAVDLSALPPDDPMRKTFASVIGDPAEANTDAWRAADLGAVNGHGNARSLARLLSVISRGGEVDGIRLLSPETIDLIFREQARGRDLVLGIPLRWGIGLALPEPATLPYLPDEKLCFWGGWGGSMVVMHPERRLTIAYVMNAMAPGIIGSDRAATYLRAIYDALA